MFENIALLLAGIGVFMVGFKLLSENIEKLANKGLKNLFNKSTKNRFIGVGVGALVTALVQSSSATTVMVVGFVNAGIMNLFQATSVIMGANIGTTITAQIVALESFDFGTFAMILTFIGVFMNMLFRKDKVKTLGNALAGMGLLFLGLYCMKTGMSFVKEQDEIQNLLSSITNPVLLLLIGIIVTSLVQSSAAVTSILISMVAAGVYIGGQEGGNSILFVILGTNIGTCVTAMLSSVGASANAKRASLIHLMFNVFGSLLFFIVLIFWKDFMDVTFKVWFKDSGTQIAMFHTFFNVFCTLLFLPFINVFVKISQILVRDKKKKEKAIIQMDSRMLEYPSVALGQLSKEISKMAFEAVNALDLSVSDFLKKETDNSEKIDECNDRLELMNKEVIKYLVDISSKTVTHSDEQIISIYHTNLNDILRIGEIADNIKKYTNTAVKENLEFSEYVLGEISKMEELIDQMFNLTDMTFNSRKTDLMDQINAIEDNVDNMRNTLIDGHLDRLKQGTCQPESSGVFINLVSNLERAADHLTYIANSVGEENKTK